MDLQTHLRYCVHLKMYAHTDKKNKHKKLNVENFSWSIVKFIVESDYKCNLISTK